MSPREFTQAVGRRIWPSRHLDAKPNWHAVRQGPLAGAELFLAPEATDTWQSMLEGTHDAALFDAVRLPLAGRTCWDVGAHIGYHSLMFAALTGLEGRTVAFEPNPANLSLQLHLERNPRLAARITVKPWALSDTTGKAKFCFAEHVESGLSSGGHLVGADVPSSTQTCAYLKETDVVTHTLDELVQEGTVPAPDLLKIDVEGAEAAVLNGGRDYLRAKRPVLMIEVHHVLQMMEVQQLLLSLGYQLQVVDREHATPSRCFVVAHP